MTRTLRTLAAKLLVGAATLFPLTLPAASAQDRQPQNAVPEAKKLTAKEQHAKLLKATGWIQQRDGDRVIGHGTGGIIDLKRRLMVTNDHVVTGQDVVWVVFPKYKDGKLVREESEYVGEKGVKAVVIDRDYTRDLAVIQLESLPEGMAALPLAANEPEEGDAVRTIGGYTNGSDNLVFGGVGGEVRTVGANGGANLTGKVRVVLTTVSINGGNSGGPLINEAGDLVAVNSYSVTFGPTGRAVSNVNGHISVKELKAYLAEIDPLVEPKGADEFSVRANRKRNAGRVDAALLDLRDALKADAKHMPALVLRAMVLNEKKDNRTALIDANNAVEVNPNEYAALLVRGRILGELKKYDAAIDDLSKAIGIDPEKGFAYNDRAIVLENSGQFADADADYTRAIEKNSKDEVFFSNRGDNRRVNLKKSEDAAKDYARALELNPGATKVVNRLGLCFMDLEKYDVAAQVFTKACQMEKNHLTYRFNLANALERNEQFKEAIEVATAVIKQAGEEKNTAKLCGGFYVRARACRGLKMYDQAVSDATNSLKFCQTDEDRVFALRCRAKAYELAGNTENAEADYAAANKLEKK